MDLGRLVLYGLETRARNLVMKLFGISGFLGSLVLELLTAFGNSNTRKGVGINFFSKYVEYVHKTKRSPPFLICKCLASLTGPHKVTI